MKYLFGIDVGGTTIKFGLLDEDANLISKEEIPTRVENNGEFILEDIANKIISVLTERNIKTEEILGIGLGIPGPVVNNYVSQCVNLGWKDLYIEKELSSHLGFKTVIKAGNDANVAALGEMIKGSKESYKNAVMFTLGTGVGGGIIIDSKPLEGVHGAAGELGHIHIDDKHNYQCNCGLKGCLETVSSATGIVRLFNDYLSKGETTTITDYSCRHITDGAKNGDKLCVKVVEEATDYLAKAAAMVAVTCDPEVFIIGGGVSYAGTYITDMLSKYYKKYAFNSVKDIPFILSSLGNDSGMVGSALLAKMK